MSKSTTNKRNGAVINTAKTPELITNSLKIDKLIKRIDDGDIKVPAFQRGYVWKQDQIIELLQSVISDYPIGSILLWEASEKDKLRSTRNIAGYLIPDRPMNYPVSYVLDGQQRLSSIYATFSECVKQDESSEKYNPDLGLFELYYNFEKGDFFPKSEVDPGGKCCVYLRNLIDPIKLFDELANIDKRYHIKAKELSSKFLNYDLPVVTIKNRSRKDVGMIFERINNTGTRLDVIDLMTAWTWTEDFHLLDATSELQEDLDEKGYGLVSNKVILQLTSGIIKGSTTTDSILSLSGEEVRDNWKLICNSLKLAVDFLSTEFNCRNIEFLPFIQQLIVLAKFYSIQSAPNSDQTKAIKAWFWRTSFSDRYSTGKTTRKMDDDIEVMQNIGSGKYLFVRRYSYNVTAPDFLKHAFSKTNPITRASLLLMAQKNPLDLTSAQKIDVGDALSIYNRKEYHHIFPNAHLKSKGVAKSKRYCILNFCFLPAKSNKKISARSPSDYFKNVIPQNHKLKILESNIIPDGKAIYTTNDYDKFLKERSALFISEIDKVCKFK